jgi:hypothetical protein
LRELREKYPAQTQEERHLLKVYRNVIQEFAREILKPRDNIDADVLNELSHAATAAFVRYMAARLWR